MNEWIDNTKKELVELEKGPEVNIHLESVNATLKKIPN